MVESVGAMVPPRSRNYRGRGRHLAGGADVADGTCSVEGCEHTARARGWCKAHWQRWRRTGDPLTPDRRHESRPRGRTACDVDGCDAFVQGYGLCPKHYHRRRRGRPVEADPPRSVEERMAVHCVRTANGCLEWTGGRDSSGYGTVTLPDGRSDRIHRIAFAMAHGPIPAGMYVCHHCDNPPCFDVEHLFLGTPADNYGDALAKGRARRGADGRLLPMRINPDEAHARGFVVRTEDT